MKSPAERGVIGAWAYEARADADLSVPQVITALAAKGVTLTDSTLRGIEGGSKKPGGRLLRLLSEIYDRPVPGAEPLEAPVSDVAAAIREQTERLVAEQREMRSMLREMIEGLATRVSEDSVELKAGQAYLVRLVGALGVELGVPPERVLAAGGDVPAGSETVNTNAGQ